VETLQLCQKVGLVKLGHVSLDGTKVRANASKHKAMSYGRMKQEEKGRETYSKRKSTMEPVFGQIKRAKGFVQFSLRGLEKMRGEWSLVCLTHNLLKLFAAQHAVAA